MILSLFVLGSGGRMPPSPARLSVYLTDAPGDVDDVWVRMDDMVLEGDAGGVSLLSEPTELIELTRLKDLARAVVEDAAIPPGTYRRLRIVLGACALRSGESVYVKGDARPGDLEVAGDLECADHGAEGIPVILEGPVELAEGQRARLELDFSVRRSFHRPEGPWDAWVMDPVVEGSVDVDEG